VVDQLFGVPLVVLGCAAFGSFWFVDARARVELTRNAARDRGPA
jgi:hypothetical protein